jgi:hypothetical protein
MSGALWVVVIATLLTTKWPQFGWLTGLVTAVAVIVAGAGYWIAVVTNDTDKPDANYQRESVPAKQSLGRGEETGRSSFQHREAVEAYVVTAVQQMHVASLQAEKFREVYERHVEALRRYPSRHPADPAWTSDDVRNWLVHSLSPPPSAIGPGRGAEGGTRRSHRLYQRGGRVVLTVGSVKIEIEEEDDATQANIHITPSKTLVTNIIGAEDREQQGPKEFSPKRSTTATIH